MADEENAANQPQRDTGLNEDGDPKIPENFVPDIEDEAKQEDARPPQEEPKKEEEEEPLISKKMLIIIIALGGITLILAGVLVFLVLTRKPNVEEAAPPPPPPRADIATFKTQKIDNIIKKANILYSRGDKKEALELYTLLANYSRALSKYNYGVIKMRAGAYREAIENFKAALNSRENKTVAAINIAVCYLKLRDYKQFGYYISLANVFLPNEANSPLYNYYLALIKYYKGLYPEALQMFVNSEDIGTYGDDAHYLGAKIYTKMNLDEKAIKFLKKQQSYEASLPMGLLYARMGKYEEALKYLSKAAMVDSQVDRANIAAALVNMRTGDYNTAQSILERVKEPDKIYKYYPIKVVLKKELYDIQLAQKHFQKDFLKTLKERFDFLFYFADYRVFDYKEALRYFHINQIDMSAFVTSTNSDRIGNPKTHEKVSQAVLYALDHKLIAANKYFNELVANHRENGVLHYDLALTYAQLQNYKQAMIHFSAAYHLNPKDYQAGVFALMCYKILGLDSTKFTNEMQDNMSFDKNTQKVQYYSAFMRLVNGDNASLFSILEHPKKNTPLKLMLSIIVAADNDKVFEESEDIAKLRNLLPRDILANILYFNNQNKTKNIKNYAMAAQLYFTTHKLDYRPLYSSAKVVKDNYIALMQVAGLLNIERRALRRKLSLGTKDQVGVMSALAYIDIFAKQYDESYALYNILLDKYKLSDSNTLFLASVAAIGSKNPNSAIALLELSKFGNTANKDARLALGLLYQQVKNLQPALFQYQKVGNGYKSKFFTFVLEEGE